MKKSEVHHLDRFIYSESDFLGKGSFGTVYKGTDQNTKEQVALKIMDMSLFTDQFMIDALKTEISVMKQLKQDHIVRLFEVFESKQQTIIVIELCNGGDLRGLLEKSENGMLDEQTATEILKQVMQGFKEMVRNGYIHRDIKPENFLINNNVHKVADFGFACKCDIHGKQLLKESVGTPLYMAPQLLERRPYSAKSDIWSIGILAYEMLYGCQPWPCRDCNSYLNNMKNSPLKFPFSKKVSNEFKDFVTRCLEIEEDQRIDWDDVFNHPILTKKFSERTFTTEKIDPRSQLILQEIQQAVQARNININQLFQQGGKLNKKEFYNFITSIDQRITQNESLHLFGLFDKDGDGSLSLDEFKRIFCDYDFADIKDKAGQIIVDLQEIVKANNLSLNDIFNNFDADKGGSLDFKEFSKLIRVIAPAMKDNEISKIFQEFDSDSDGDVSFEEFKRKMCYAVPNQDSQFNPIQEKAKKVIEELKRIVKVNNVDYNQIFKNFDKDQDNSLDKNEFYKLCQIIDKNLSFDESQLVFRLVDKNDDGTIMNEEFKKLFIQ